MTPRKILIIANNNKFLIRIKHYNFSVKILPMGVKCSELTTLAYIAINLINAQLVPKVMVLTSLISASSVRKIASYAQKIILNVLSVSNLQPPSIK